MVALSNTRYHREASLIYELRIIHFNTHKFQKEVQISFHSRLNVTFYVYQILYRYLMICHEKL